MSDRLLTVTEAAEMLRTSERFPRRLIAERRIRFTRVGRHVRIPESALREFIAAGLVEPLTTRKKKDAALWPNDDSAESGSFRRVAIRLATQAQTTQTGLLRRPSPMPGDPEFRAALVGYLEWGTRLAMHNSQPGADVVHQAPVPRWGWGVAPPYQP
jgi:excisionase family DNA binding protein